jgi:hypothetical protein
MLHRVAFVRTDVSEGLDASFIRVTRIGELATMLAVTSNRHTLCVGCSLLLTENGNLHSHRREDLKSYQVININATVVKGSDYALRSYKHHDDDTLRSGGMAPPLLASGLGGEWSACRLYLLTQVGRSSQKAGGPLSRSELLEWGFSPQA